MKKDVAASAAGAVAPKKPEFSLIDEDLLKSRIYTIRGVKVMLDADLAEIYGYSTKDFNRQVKNNIERFAEDFRFQLTKREVEELRSKKFTAITDANDAKDLRCKNCTANISTMSRSNPYVFTEQGIYMLMTVLKGDLAVQQSMALIRLFKQMKDYIAAENAPDVRTLSSKVERNESFLQKVMEKRSVLIVDDYLDVKTLDLLRCVAKGVSIKIFSEQHGRTRLTESMLADFRAARPDVELGDVRTTGNVFHDRYIYLDFRTDSEKLFHCGASCIKYEDREQRLCLHRHCRGQVFWLVEQRCGQQDHDHHAAGRYRGVSSIVREAAARGGIKKSARGVDDEERCCGQCGRCRDLFSNPPHCPIDNL